jgi:signal transduction histidine kinase
MKNRRKISEAAFFKLTFIGSILMLLLIAAVSFNQLNKVSNAQKSLIKSRERQIELAKLYSHVKDAETLQRAYLLTGDSIYLRSYKDTRNKAYTSLAELKKLCSRNTERYNQLTHLHTIIEKRFVQSGRAFHDQAKSAPPTALNASFREGLLAMQELGVLVDKISHTENIALQRYERLHNKDNKYLPYLTGALVAFCILVLLLSYYRIYKGSKKIKEINHDLQLMNQSFLHAEEMSAMGHWKRNLITGDIEPSDNMFRLLGVAPRSIPFTEASLLTFVHPEDKLMLMEGFRHVREGERLGLTYRMIRADGAVRYFRSEARFERLEDIPMMLGATRDVTAEIEKSRDIEEKNRQLEQMVQELASFNHVASHDLQEPLRKIQVFISRILADEGHKLSETGQDYFERITASADRMETLIDDLLLYSETGKEGHVFETADLNTILKDALAELSAETEIKKAVIHAGNLPALPVIPFQIRQLFVNLLGNALKYSKADVPPVITVTCKKVKGRQAGDSHKTYYEITVTDNGIGFPREYAEKIFVLFHRLHNKSRYSGTGIGLAICKKIMENHHGSISAESTPGEGAAFICCFPV